MVNGKRGRIPAEERKRSQTGYKRALAYGRLGIHPNDVQRMPFFQAELARIGRLLNLGRAQDEPIVCPFNLLQSSEDADARKAWNAYDSVPESYRRLLPAEVYCHAADVCPTRVLTAIAAEAVRQGVQASAIVASVMHPRVVKKTIERALQDDGTKERMMLHRATGFVPGRG